MSRFHFDVDEKRAVTLGMDSPMRTFFAQLWNRDFDDDFDTGAPEKAVGYHPAEKMPPLAGEYGPYPVPTADALDAYLRRAWKIDIPDDVYAKLSAFEL